MISLSVVKCSWYPKLLYVCNGIASSPDRVKYIEYSSWQRFHSSLVEMLETDVWIYLRHRSGCEMRYQWYSDFPVASDATHHMDTPQYHIWCVTEILACPIYVQCCTSMLFLSFPCFLLVFTICSLCVLHSSLSHLRLFTTVRYPFATIQDCSPHDQDCLLHIHYTIKIATIRDCLLHIRHCSLLFITRSLPFKIVHLMIKIVYYTFTTQSRLLPFEIVCYMFDIVHYCSLHMFKIVHYTFKIICHLDCFRSILI